MKVKVGLLGVALWFGLPGPPAKAVEVPFAATGAEASWTVPAGVERIHVVAIGGSGAAPGNQAAGRGAIATADLSVVPGSTLYVNVGGSATTAQGGFNGGGDGGDSPAGGGGGASDVRSLSRAAADAEASLDSRLIVAGGGGGDGETGSVLFETGVEYFPGGAGADAGSQGGSCTVRMNHAATGGGPGASTTGGSGGETGGETGRKGAGGKGGHGVTGGGGGGGGLYGGGGGGQASELEAGCGAGGGGGSSGFAVGATNASVVVNSAGLAPSVTISYTPAPDPPVVEEPGPPPPPSWPTRDEVAPVLAGLRLSPSRFASARSGPSIAAKRVGTTVAVRLSEPARLRFRVKRAVRGIRSAGRCRRQRGRRRAGARRCTAYVVVKGSFGAAGAAGMNRVRFTGRLRGRALAPGAYRLVAVATDAAGNRSTTVRRAFRMVRRRA